MFETSHTQCVVYRLASHINIYIMSLLKYLFSEKFDPPKSVLEQLTSPDEEDLFSDCRSELDCPDLGRSPTLPLTEQNIKERLQLGRAEVEEEEEDLLSVRVEDPHKVGDGMTSYMAYRVLTRTSLHCFRRQSSSVVRRYSDFLALHEKLVGRYQCKGRIIPPAPEKDLLGTTRVKMGGASESPLTPGGGEAGAGSAPHCKANFISRRRAALERFINRVALHPVLRLDQDFIDFLESEGELPRATSAISSASVFRIITRVGDTVNKMAYKMEEGDDWFEEKTQHVEQMETQLKKLYGIVETVVTYRRDLATATGQFAQSAANLANSEEAFHLSRALEGLARTEEKVEVSLQDQADADYAYILELIRDYLALVAAVKDVLGERVKTFLAWQNAVNTLHKKREQRSRMELGGRLDKVVISNPSEDTIVTLYHYTALQQYHHIITPQYNNTSHHNTIRRHRHQPLLLFLFLDGNRYRRRN